MEIILKTHQQEDNPAIIAQSNSDRPKDEFANKHQKATTAALLSGAQCGEPTFKGMKFSGVYFPKAQAKVLLTCMCRRVATKDLLIDVIWPDPDHMPLNAINVISVYITKIRNKIRPLGWDLFCVWGAGYSLMTLEEAAAAKALRRSFR